MSPAQNAAVRPPPPFPLICCLAALAMTRPAFGTQATRLQPGARVRLDAPSQGGRLTGTLLAVESDTLVMEEDGQAAGLRLIILTDSISRLEVRRERSMAFEGAGLGLLGGTLLALVASPDCTDENGEDQTLACLAYKVSPNPETRFFALAVVGTLVGVMVGSETKTQKWAPVRLPRPFIGPTPGGGMALGLRISF